MYEIHLRIRYFERVLSKTLKKVNFIFSFELSPFWWTKLWKTKGTWNKWPVALEVTKQVHKNFFFSYIISDQVWYCTIKRFLSYSKNYTCKFMQANSWHHKLFHFHLSFWIWIVKTWISREWKELFHNFWRAITWWKNENLIKNSGHKL